MADTTRFSRPYRRVLGLAAMVVASADVAAIASNSGSPTGAAAAAARLPMTVYGLLLLAVGLWCVATSFATRNAANPDEVDDLPPFVADLPSLVSA